MKAIAVASVLLAGANTLTGCGADRVDATAERYVALASVDPVDRRAAERLLRAIPEPGSSERKRFLQRQLRALAIETAASMSFDEESTARYGVVIPPPDMDASARILAEIDALLPGDGTVVERYASLVRRFVVPEEKREELLGAAIAETRRRTREHLELPAGESVAVRWVEARPWPAFHSYLGDFRSEILVNRDFPFTIRSVVDIAAHEGYPGHHVASMLADEHLVRGRGWVELSLTPPGTPRELVVEGLANHAVDLVFPGEERLRFEAEVLVPLAGLEVSSDELERYLAVEARVARLAPLLVEGARRYLDGDRDRVATAIWLETHALAADPRAFLRFVDRYRTLVVAYTHGRDLAREFLRASGRDPWFVYGELLTRPTLPEDLMDAT